MPPSTGSSTPIPTARLPTNRCRRCSWRSFGVAWTAARSPGGRRRWWPPVNGWISAICAAAIGRWSRWTSTPPVGWATRPRWRWCPSSPPAAPRCPRRPAGGWVTPAARWTNWNASPGFTVEMSNARVRQQLCDIGAAIFAAGQLAPADKKLYALRDITATVESVPLIASSMMSKKLAEGIGALVLDVKVGAGALLESEAQCRELAHTMVELGGGARGAHPRAVDRHEQPAGRDRRQCDRGRRGAGGAGRRRSARRGGADAAAGRRDARRWPGSTAAIPARRCATAPRWTDFAS